MVCMYCASSRDDPEIWTQLEEEVLRQGETRTAVLRSQPPSSVYLWGRTGREGRRRAVRLGSLRRGAAGTQGEVTERAGEGDAGGSERRGREKCVGRASRKVWAVRETGVVGRAEEGCALEGCAGECVAMAEGGCSAAGRAARGGVKARGNALEPRAVADLGGRGGG